MKTQKDMNFDPSIFETTEADVFGLDDGYLNAQNSFDTCISNQWCLKSQRFWDLGINLHKML